MKKLLLIPFLMFVTFFISLPQSMSQKIYSCDNKYDADFKVFVVDNKYDADLLVYKLENKYDAKDNKGLWFFTESKYDADKLIFFSDSKYDADLLIFFVESKYDSGWREKQKIHLLY